jgi:hypothetical protein
MVRKAMRGLEISPRMGPWSVAWTAVAPRVTGRVVAATYLDPRAHDFLEVVGRALLA